MKKSISILTPSVRPTALLLNAHALANQTEKEWEWLICGPEENRQEVDKVIGKTVAYQYLGNLPLKKEMFWDLNYSYNRLFKKASGEVVVSLQDSIWIPSDTLEKMILTLKFLPGKKIISGISDQYERLNKFGKPEVKIWSDPRRTDKYGGLYPAYYNDIEWNLCAMDKDIIFDIGGFDEEMDFRCRGVDAIQVMERLAEFGVETYLSQEIESYTLRHGREVYGGEEAWNASHGLFNGKYDERKRELIKSGKWPILDYLKITP